MGLIDFNVPADGDVGLYVLYDVLAEDSGPVFTAKNDQVAVRSVVIMLLGQESIRVEDYELRRIGLFAPYRSKIVSDNCIVINYLHEYYTARDKQYEDIKITEVSNE